MLSVLRCGPTQRRQQPDDKQETKSHSNQRSMLRIKKIKRKKLNRLRF